MADIAYCSLTACNYLFQLRRGRRISWRAFGLGMALASFAGKDDGEAWPSRTTLSAITGVEESDISRVVHELKASGFLEIKSRDGQSNIYRLTHGEIATGSDTDTRGRLATHNNKEQFKNNKGSQNNEKPPSCSAKQRTKTPSKSNAQKTKG